VSFVFTTGNLPAAALISPVRVSKQPLEVYSVPQQEPQAEMSNPIQITKDPDEDTEDLDDSPI